MLPYRYLHHVIFICPSIAACAAMAAATPTINTDSDQVQESISRLAHAQCVKPSKTCMQETVTFPKSTMDKTLVSQPVVREASQIEPLSLDLSLAEGVDKELTCAVCLARYKHPKVLPCLHTYCQNCLESLSGATSKLTCPQCKEVHEVPSGGVSSFKTYFTINNLIELLHIHEVSSCNGESGKTIQCESGLDEHAAVARCLSCSEYLCESCYGIHRRLKATRDHNMITLEKIKNSDKKLGVQSIQRKQYCEEHDDEVLKLFCKTCNKVICRDCALVKHREHDYSFIREVHRETRNQLELLLKKVEEKESEFQGHKKHVEGLQRSNEDTLNSCLKDVNEMCDKLIEVIESRRAYLVAKLHSKHEAEEEQNKGEMNSIDLSLVRLSDSIRFTRKLLDDGNDIELMTVGMQAKEALEGLSTMEWNQDAVRPSLLRLEFAPAVEDMKTFGKVLNTIQSSDILIENIPHIKACVGDKLEFSVKLSDEIATRQYDAAALLSVTVTHNVRKIPVAIQNNGLNSWNISCTLQDGGEHSIIIQFGQFASQSYKFVALLEEPPGKEVKYDQEISCKEMPVCDAYEIPCATEAHYDDICIPCEHKQDVQPPDYAVAVEDEREISAGIIEVDAARVKAVCTLEEKGSSLPYYDQQVWSSQACEEHATGSAEYPTCGQETKSPWLEDLGTKKFEEGSAIYHTGGQEEHESAVDPRGTIMAMESEPQAVSYPSAVDSRGTTMAMEPETQPVSCSSARGTTMAMEPETQPVSYPSAVDPRRTTMAMEPETQPVSYPSAVDPRRTTMAMEPETQPVSCSSVVDPRGTTMAMEPETQPVSCSSAVDPRGTTMAMEPETQPVSYPSAVDPRRTTMAMEPETQPVPCSSAVDPRGTTMAMEPETQPVSCSSAVDSRGTTMAMEPETQPVSYPSAVDPRRTTMAMEPETQPVSCSSAVDPRRTTMAMEPETQPVSCSSAVDPRGTTMAMEPELQDVSYPSPRGTIESEPQAVSYPVAANTPLRTTTMSHYSTTSSRGQSSYFSHRRHW